MRNVTITPISGPANVTTVWFTQEIRGRELLKQRGTSANPQLYDLLRIQIDFDLKDLIIVHVKFAQLGMTFRLKENSSIMFSIGDEQFSIKTTNEM